MKTSAITKQPTTHGILLIALGSPQYGCYAANLAASIRCNDPALPIHLVHTTDSISQLAPAHLALFTSLAVCPKEAYTRTTGNQQPTTEYIRAKTWMYELSPFDETIFIDVDAVILPGHSLTDLFTQLSSACEFTMQNRGHIDLAADRKFKGYTVWCDTDEFKKHYKRNKGLFYQYQSEFAFFKKNKKNKAYFDLARSLYDEPTIRTEKFDTGIPDEYCFNLATALLHHYPAESGKVFLYWNFLDGYKDWYRVINKEYVGFSLGGSSISRDTSLRVKAYINFFRKRLGLPYLFTPHHKRQWNRNRGEM